MNRTPDLFLGIDGGGTGCRALLCNGAGDALGIGLSGAANIMSDFDGAKTNIVDAAQKALVQAGVTAETLPAIPAFLGLAGANIGSSANLLKKDLPFKTCSIDTDAVISLEGAVGSSDGLAAIIGTGSVFVYRTAGLVRTVGGWGFMVGDLASGAWLGRHLLQEVLLSYDGIHAGSPLTRRVLDEFENDPQTVVEYAHTAMPGEFGKFAPLIFDYADQRDPIARRIVRRAVSDIEETLDKILADDTARFCMLGGLGRIYANLLSAYYRERVREPIADAVTGAAKLAVKNFAKEKA